MQSIIAVNGKSMGARVVCPNGNGWIALAQVDGVIYEADGDTPEEAADALAGKIAANAQSPQKTA